MANEDPRKEGDGEEPKPHELHRTKRGFTVRPYTNDIGHQEFQVRNWRGTVLTTRRWLEDAIKRADELEEAARQREETGHGKKK